MEQKATLHSFLILHVSSSTIRTSLLLSFERSRYGEAMKTLKLWMPSNAEESSVSMDAHTWVGMWDLCKGIKQLSVSRLTSQILLLLGRWINIWLKYCAETKNTKQNMPWTPLESPWWDRALPCFISMSWIIIYVQTIYALYEALTQQRVGLSIHWQTPFSSLSVLHCRDNFSALFPVRPW